MNPAPDILRLTAFASAPDGGNPAGLVGRPSLLTVDVPAEGGIRLSGTAAVIAEPQQSAT